jgi:SAM-dependent methyltransferase
MSIRLVPRPIRHCLNYLHHYGLRIALRDAKPYLRELIFRTERRTERAEQFDSRFATDTSSPVWPWDLPSIRSSGREILGYEAVPAQALRDILKTLPLDDKRFAFVDLGCGKGRPLLVASEFPFSKVVGVELSTELHAIAERNLEIYRPPDQRCRNFELHTLDAAEYMFPSDPLIVFLYNPFGEKTMRRVFANLHEALRRSGKSAYVIYMNPQFEPLLHIDFLRRLPSPSSYSLYLYEASNK